MSQARPDTKTGQPAEKKTGRSSKLTPETQDRIVQALRVGAYREDAALYAGIHVATLYRWLETGEADEANNIESPHRELREAVKGAEARAEVDMLTIINKAAIKNWQAAAWRLERKNPAKWGKRDAVEVSGDVQHNVSVDLVPEDEQRAEIARLLAVANGDAG